MTEPQWFLQPQLKDCNTRGHNDKRKKQKEESQAAGINHKVVPGLSRFLEESHDVLQSWQHLSDWSSGPKHFTIFSKNCWTVENHLIRMTTHFLSVRSLFKTVESTCENKTKKRTKQLKLVWENLCYNESTSKPHCNTKKHKDRLQSKASQYEAFTWRDFFFFFFSFEYCSLVSSLPKLSVCGGRSSFYTISGLSSYKPPIQERMRPMLV